MKLGTEDDAEAERQLGAWERETFRALGFNATGT